MLAQVADEAIRTTSKVLDIEREVGAGEREQKLAAIRDRLVIGTQDVNQRAIAPSAPTDERRPRYYPRKPSAVGHELCCGRIQEPRVPPRLQHAAAIRNRLRQSEECSVPHTKPVRVKPQAPA